MDGNSEMHYSESISNKEFEKNSEFSQLKAENPNSIIMNEESHSSISDYNDNKSKVKKENTEISDKKLIIFENNSNEPKECNFCNKKFNNNDVVFASTNINEKGQYTLHCQNCFETNTENQKDFIKINQEDIEIYDIQQADDPETKKLKIQINPKKFEIPNNSLLTYLIICQGNNELMKAPKPELPITGKKNKITNPIYFDISKFPPGNYEIMFLIKSPNVNNQDYDYFGNIHKMKKDFTIRVI